MLAIRARALIQGRLVPGLDDVAALAHPVLIHRMALGFAARAEGQTLDRADRPAGRRHAWAWRPRRDRAAPPARQGQAPGAGRAPPRRREDRAARCRRCSPQAEHPRGDGGDGLPRPPPRRHGENFWQYRQAVPGDPRSAVDWRRSGKSDQQFIREMEWEAAQTVSIWVDDALVDGLPRRRALQGALQGRAGVAPGARGLGAPDQGRRAGGADGHRRGASRAPGAPSSTAWRWRSAPSRPDGTGPTTAPRRPTGWRTAAGRSSSPTSSATSTR